MGNKKMYYLEFKNYFYEKKKHFIDALGKVLV